MGKAGKQLLDGYGRLQKHKGGLHLSSAWLLALDWGGWILAYHKSPGSHVKEVVEVWDSDWKTHLQVPFVTRHWVILGGVISPLLPV